MQSAGCRGSRRTFVGGRGSQCGVRVVLVPRRRPPAGPPGHREGTAEALSSQGAMVAGFWGWTGPPKGKGVVEQSPARARLSQCSWGEQGHGARGPSATGIPARRCHCMSPLRGPIGLQRGSPGHLGLVHLLRGPAWPAPLVVQRRIFTVVPGAWQARRVPAWMGGQWNDALGQERGWSARRRHR